MLSPTGRMRADVHVGAAGDTFLLLQDPSAGAGSRRPRAVRAVLRRRVGGPHGSRRGRRRPRRLRRRGRRRRPRLEPSVLGSGRTVVVRAGEPARALRQRFIDAGLVESSRPTSSRGGSVGASRGPVSTSAPTPSRGGRTGGHDRLHEGVLPGPGVRGQGGQPGPSTAARGGGPSATPVAPGATVLADEEPVGSIAAPPTTTEGRPLSLGSVGRQRVVRSRWRARARSPYGSRSRQFGSFRIGHLGVCACPTDDPFPGVVTPCYSFGPGTRGDPEGRSGTVRIDRLPTFDVGALPDNPSPPDVWQERSACYGIDPDVFFPISEEEAGPALAFCSACMIRPSASPGR